VRVRRVRRARVTRRLEQARHPLGVVHVHLAPVRADGVAAGHVKRVDVRTLDLTGHTRHDARVELTRRQVLTAALTAAGLTVLPGCGSPFADVRLRIATGSTAGEYFRLGRALAAVW